LILYGKIGQPCGNIIHSKVVMGSDQKFLIPVAGRVNCFGSGWVWLSQPFLGLGLGLENFQ